MSLKIYLNSPLAKWPTRGSAMAAGWDLYAAINHDIVIAPGHSVMIDTGLIMEIPYNYFGAIYPRSGLACKNNIRLSNCTAVIDSDYRGEVKVSLYNDGTTAYTVRPGDRIAQLVIQPYLTTAFVKVTDKNELTDTVRSSGGFGSTGTN